MLLRRIKLKGFLGHRGLLNGSANSGELPDEFVDIDFTSSSLWLVHGQNGCGKSSLWDALTFALFKQHRGGGDTKSFRHLIHDNCEKAEVKIEFELQSEIYQVYGSITKAKSRKPQNDNQSVSTLRRVLQRNGDAWQTIADSEEKVKGWLGKNIPTDFNTFVSAVLLRQGEADKFLNTSSNRIEILTKLLQFGFYKLLSETATTRGNEIKKKAVELRQALDAMPNPSEEEMASQRELINRMEAELTQLTGRLKSKEEELSDARQAQKLASDIAVRESQLQQDNQLFERAEQIEKDALCFRALRSGLQFIEALWEARNEFKRELQSLEEQRDKTSRIETKLRELSVKLNAARSNESSAQEQFKQVEAQYEQAMRQRDEFARQLSQLNQVEGIESQIKAAQARLLPHQTILNRREQIQNNFVRYQELGAGIELLAELELKQNRLAAAKEKLDQTNSTLQTYQEQAETAKQNAEQAKLQETGVASEYESLRRDLNECESNLKVINSQLGERSHASGKVECPTCGSELDESAQARVQHQITHYQKEIARLETEKNRLSDSLAGKEIEWRQVQEEIRKKDVTTQELWRKVERLGSDRDHANDELARADSEFNAAWQQVGEWANQFEQLKQLQRELNELSSTPAERDRLLRALDEEGNTRTAIDIHRGCLAELPTWSETERQQIHAAATVNASEVSQSEQARETALNRHKQAQSSLKQLEKEQSNLTGQLQSEQQQIAEKEQREERAREKHDRAKVALPAEWVNHPASEKDDELEVLRWERDQLSTAEAQADKLKEALERKIKLDSEIKARRELIEAILIEHRRDAGEVEDELSSLIGEKQSTDQKLREEQDQLRDFEQQRQAAVAKREERDQSERTSSLHQKLADALGRKGLLASVVQEAQDRIKIHANEILKRLSNGTWEVDLKNVSETELRIDAHDLTTGTLRPFEYLSGGERFRVAISIAIAIGQSILGNRTVDTLVIDEGFGALDNNNRTNLINELNNLSTGALSRGRIIIVSHQDDVQDAFPFRYRLSRNLDGLVEIESSLGGYLGSPSSPTVEEPSPLRPTHSPRASAGKCVVSKA